jgi:hypothetical protein
MRKQKVLVEISLVLFGVGAASQAWTVTDKRSGLQTRIVTMESVSLRLEVNLGAGDHDTPVD